LLITDDRIIIDDVSSTEIKWRLGAIKKSWAGLPLAWGTLIAGVL
jgi:hypothetical protein